MLYHQQSWKAALKRPEHLSFFGWSIHCAKTLDGPFMACLDGPFMAATTGAKAQAMVALAGQLRISPPRGMVPGPWAWQTYSLVPMLHRQQSWKAALKRPERLSFFGWAIHGAKSLDGPLMLAWMAHSWLLQLEPKRKQWGRWQVI